MRKLRIMEDVALNHLEEDTDLSPAEITIVKAMMTGDWQCVTCTERSQGDEGIYCRFHLIWEPLPCEAWEERKEEA